jgi:hypothetical protein
MSGLLVFSLASAFVAASLILAADLMREVPSLPVRMVRRHRRLKDASSARITASSDDAAAEAHPVRSSHALYLDAKDQHAA